MSCPTCYIILNFISLSLPHGILSRKQFNHMIIISCKIYRKPQVAGTLLFSRRLPRYRIFPAFNRDLSIMPPTLVLRDASDAFPWEPVALAAIIVAGVALIVCLMQVFLTYRPSLPERSKCSHGALGGWEMYLKTRRHWWKGTTSVRYPVVQLNCTAILFCRALAGYSKQEVKTLQQLSSSPQYGWADRKHCKVGDLGFWHVWSGSNFFFGPGQKPITVFQLPSWRGKVEWLKYIITHKRQHPVRALASWANLISCFGVQPSEAKQLLLGHETADIISHEMDAPWQTTTLSNIGICCFALGFRDVKINLSEGTISARNEYAAIETAQTAVLGLPRVVTISGDLDSLRAAVAKPTTASLIAAALRANGMIDWINFYTNPFYCAPLFILYALQSKWKNRHIRRHVSNLVRRGSHTSVGSLYWESNQAECAPENWATYWSGLQVGKCPSIIQLLPFIPFNEICAGFPLRSFLLPYKNYFQQTASGWWSEAGHELCDLDDALTLSIASGDVKFLREENSFLVTANVDSDHGSRSWIFDYEFTETLQNWDRDQLRKIIDRSAKFPVSAKIHNILRTGSLDEVRAKSTRPESFTAGDMRDVLKSTVEAELWFALFTIEARIRARWVDLVNQEDDGESSGPRNARELSGLVNKMARSQKLSLPHPSQQQADQEVDQETDQTEIVKDALQNIPSREIDANLAYFLALWVEICHDVEPFSGIASVQNSFKRIVETWKQNDERCIPVPTDINAWEYPETTGPKTRGWFHNWLQSADRLHKARLLLPWLQLRGILMYHYFCCNGDSSDVAAAESNELRVQVA